VGRSQARSFSRSGSPSRTQGSLFTDAQNEVLSEQGGAWKLVRDSVMENKTVEHMERIFQTAKLTGFEVFISPTITSPQITGGSSVIPSGR